MQEAKVMSGEILIVQFSENWGSLITYIKDRVKDLFGTDDWTRTSTSEENGFWIRRVYQFRHIGIVIFKANLILYEYDI